MTKEEIKKLVGTDKIVLGTDKVKSMMKKGKLAKAFVASNADRDVKAELERYSSISGTEVEELDVPNEEVGVLCRKPFPVSVLGKKK